MLLPYFYISYSVILHLKYTFVTTNGLSPIEHNHSIEFAITKSPC